jgi:NAD(P)-dependent dehydrogenase (short-subunit alcohol dehydrogenase family)
MDLAIAGLRVLVTAGAGGIGRSIVDAFVQEGAAVATCDISQTALDSLNPMVGRVRADVSHRAEVASMMQAVIDRLGGLDVLVNNAGISGPTGKIDSIQPEAWDRCLDVCLTGQFNCARLAVPHLRESPNASIVNISSIAGHMGFALRSPYSAAKWGVIGLTKSLSAELGSDGIRVNAIMPGLVEGERQRQVLEAKALERGVTYATIEREALTFTSLGQYVTADQVAYLTLFLASAKGAMISGQAIAVDGDTRMLA